MAKKISTMAEMDSRTEKQLLININGFAAILETVWPDESPEVDYFTDHHFLPVRLSYSARLIVLSSHTSAMQRFQMSRLVVDPHLTFCVLFRRLLSRAAADGRSSTLLELRQTVTHGDNVNVIRLYLDEWDVMPLNVDKAEPLLPKGRPLWVRCDLIFKNAKIHTSRGTKLAEFKPPTSDCWCCGITFIFVSAKSFLIDWWWELEAAGASFYIILISKKLHWVAHCDIRDTPTSTEQRICLSGPKNEKKKIHLFIFKATSSFSKSYYSSFACSIAQKSKFMKAILVKLTSFFWQLVSGCGEREKKSKVFRTEFKCIQQTKVSWVTELFQSRR